MFFFAVYFLFSFVINTLGTESCEKKKLEKNKSLDISFTIANFFVVKSACCRIPCSLNSSLNYFLFSQVNSKLLRTGSVNA